MSDLVQRAKEFSEVAHGFQKRKYTGEPYTVHTNEVAEILQKYGFKDEVVAAGHLHDTVEDTPVTIQEIEEIFGKEVAQLVNEVTDVSKPSDGNRKIRKELDRQHLAKASPNGQSIKLADIYSNNKSIVENDPNFAKVWLKEKAELMKVLTKGDGRLYDLVMSEMT